jgi:hypothetical protein
MPDHDTKGALPRERYQGSVNAIVRKRQFHHPSDFYCGRIWPRRDTEFLVGDLLGRVDRQPEESSSLWFVQRDEVPVEELQVSLVGPFFGNHVAVNGIQQFGVAGFGKAQDKSLAGASKPVPRFSGSAIVVCRGVVGSPSNRTHG